MTAVLLMFILTLRHPHPLPLVLEDGDFLYSFNTSETLNETDRAADSPSPYWWLDSGAQFIVGGGAGKTIQGSLAAGDLWRVAYSASNPVDTDDGSHPQNIFRLVTKSLWRDVREESYFLVARGNPSVSDNRNASNGLLLFGRYQDHDDLYYAGIRVDGAAVIKKKIHGTYYELGYQPYFRRSPMQVAPDNFLPQNTWIGLRMDIWNLSSHSVRITLSIDPGDTGTWIPLLNVVDDGKHFGSGILGAGSAGIRTDFMDVQFKDFHLWKLDAS